MIIPTIGRVVLVKHPDFPDHQRLPALVCYVHSPICINVGGFTANGQPFSAASVQLLQDADKPINLNLFAEWMPYQKQVAAKETVS